MKKLPFLFTLAFCVQLLNGQLPTKEDNIFFEMIDSVTKTKSELYTAARSYFVNSFNNANAVIQMDDKESGTIIGKGNFDMKVQGGMIATSYNIKFTLNVAIREGKYRIQLYDMFSRVTAPIATDGPHVALSPYFIEYTQKAKKEKFQTKFFEALKTKCTEIILSASAAIKSYSKDNF